MSEYLARMGPNGRIVIPAPLRRELGVEAGDKLIVLLDGGSIRIFTPQAAVKRAQAVVNRYVSRRGLARELIRERKEEARG